MNQEPQPPRHDSTPSASDIGQSEGTASGSSNGTSPVAGTSANNRNYFAWGCAGIAIVVVIGLTIGVAGQAYKSAAQSRYKKQFSQIVEAILQYHENHDCFPPAYTIGPDGQRLHSWRVHILPLLGQEALYQQIHLDEPWDSLHNKQFHGQRPAIFGHTYVKDTLPGEAHILAIVGPETIWPESHSAKMRQVIDGTSNTLTLMEYSRNDINWMEPRDLTRADIRTKVFPVGDINSTGAFGGVTVAMADGAVRQIAPRIDRQILSAICSINMGQLLPGVDWPPAAVDSMPELPAVRPAAEYKASVVSPYLAMKILGPKNVVYCSTFQIAWDELRKLAKGDPRFQETSDTADKLNAEHFPRSNLDPASYVATGGSMNGQVLQTIDAELGKKFPSHERIPIVASADAIVAYCYLFKQLSFRVNFERFGVPLRFDSGTRTDPVEAFGIDSLGDVGQRLKEILDQVEILDHVADSDFILKLKTRDRRDEIVLAKVEPGATLQETLAVVQQRIATPARNGFRTELGGGDKLMIPVLQIAVERHYDELAGLHFRNPAVTGLFISDAVQIIKFRVDETGAIIESEAAIIGENGHSEIERPYDRDKPRQLVFDKPFLLFVRETQAKSPYLVIWIANEELMELSRK